jgi:hypothetical protein
MLIPHLCMFFLLNANYTKDKLMNEIKFRAEFLLLLFLVKELRNFVMSVCVFKKKVTDLYLEQSSGWIYYTCIFKPDFRTSEFMSALCISIYSTHTHNLYANFFTISPVSRISNSYFVSLWIPCRVRYQQNLKHQNIFRFTQSVFFLILFSFPMALPAHSGPWPFIQFRNIFF